MMIKKILFSLIFIFISLLFPNFVRAENFLVNTSIEYTFDENKPTHVTHSIELTNLNSEYFASGYTISVSQLDFTNIKAFEDGRELEIDVSKDAQVSKINVKFNSKKVGKGNRRYFRVEFDTDKLAVKTGEVWEISIPKVADNSSEKVFSVKIAVPNSFGNLAYISPQPTNKAGGISSQSYYFDEASGANQGISAGFGNFQVFSFDINYHLENPISKTTTTEIALPPDTNFQKVYYQSITPKPDNVRVDSDGNWIASFLLKSRERIDVNAKGNVQIFSSPVRIFKNETTDTLKKYLQPSQYWQTDSKIIQELASSHKTPEEIYKFVSTKLKYDYERVKPNVVRLGALEALNNPDSAICMEFTDLFVALSRAAKIPAREINGFAYTENPNIQPLSLVADVLHAWPEYWDEKQKVWVQIDPTWGSTTGGVDYFSKLDLRHFAFVIHGSDPIRPFPPGSYKLGSNPQKDVFVNFGKLSGSKKNKSSIDIHMSSFFNSSKADITIINNGPQALYDETAEIYFDNNLVLVETIPDLPPLGRYSFVKNIPPSFLGLKNPDKILVRFVNDSQSVSTHKEYTILYNLLALFAVLTAFILTVLILIRKIKKTNVRKN